MCWPTNPIDCVFLIPPWRSFTVSGFWVVVGWIILDLISVALLGWRGSLVAHPVFFLLGLIAAAILLKLRDVAKYDDDWTLLQVITRQKKEDAGWEESWSVRKSQKENDEEESEKPRGEDDIIRLFCQCGHIIRVPCKYQGRKIHCPVCSHVITVSRSD
jgi:hypothetical protein